MSTPDFSALVVRHRAYFRTGATHSAEWREGQSTALRAIRHDPLFVPSPANLRRKDLWIPVPAQRLVSQATGQTVASAAGTRHNQERGERR